MLVVVAAELVCVAYEGVVAALDGATLVTACDVTALLDGATELAADDTAELGATLVTACDVTALLAGATYVVAALLGAGVTTV